MMNKEGMMGHTVEYDILVVNQSMVSNSTPSVLGIIPNSHTIHVHVLYICMHFSIGIFVSLKRLIKDTSQAASGPSLRKRMSDTRLRTESFVTSKAIEAHSQVQMSSEFQVDLDVHDVCFPLFRC